MINNWQNPRLIGMINQEFDLPLKPVETLSFGACDPFQGSDLAVRSSNTPDFTVPAFPQKLLKPPLP